MNDESPRQSEDSQKLPEDTMEASDSRWSRLRRLAAVGAMAAAFSTPAKDTNASGEIYVGGENSTTVIEASEGTIVHSSPGANVIIKKIPPDEKQKNDTEERERQYPKKQEMPNGNHNVVIQKGVAGGGVSVSGVPKGSEVWVNGKRIQ